MAYASGMWVGLHQVAEAHLKSGDLSRAVAFLEFALSHVLVDHDMLSGDDRKSLSADTGAAHALMARAFMVSGQVSEASEHLHRASVAFDSAGESIASHAGEFTPPAWQSLFRAFADERQRLAPNERTSLLGVMDAVAMHGPADAWVTAVRALLYQQLGRADEAMQVLAAAHSANPREPHIARALARLHLEKRDPGSARTILMALQEPDCRDGETLLLLAEADVREEHWADAIELYRQARSAMPDNADVRLGLAAALKAAGRSAEALATLDEVKDRVKGAEEWALRAGALMALRRWDESLTSLRSARACGLPREVEGTLHLARARGLHDAGRLIEADAALDEAVALSVPADDIVNLRLAILSGLERWDVMRACADEALERRPRDEGLTTAKARAHRNLKEHEKALEAMLSLPKPAEVASVRLLAVLQCEVGDFLGALNTLQPWTSDRAAAEPELLGIEGWAHQNCGGADHVRDAEGVYRAALEKKGADPWYRKGLANALRHQQRDDEARHEYREVIRMVQGAQEDQLTGAFLTCLSGWCHYCLGDFDQAADCYASGLAVAPLGIACQFDYGLVLLAGGYGAAARAEYQRTFRDLRELTPLRRCGLLYVALVDVRNAPSIVPGLVKSPEAAAIRAEVRTALQQAVQDLPAGFAALGARMREFANVDANTSPAALSAAPAALPTRQDWREFDVVGGDASATDGSGVLPPVVTRRAESDVFQVLHPTGLGEPMDGEAFLRGVLAGTIVRLPSHAPASLGARVLLVTHDLLDKADLSTLEAMETGVEWYRISVPRAALVACAATSVGERLFDRLARRLVARVIDAEKAVSLTADAAAAPGESDPGTRQAAEHAIDVVCDPQLAYQAVLAYAIAGGDPADASARIEMRRPPAAELVRLQPRWTETIVAFRKLLAQAARIDVDREEQRTKAAKALQGQLLQTARDVASLSDASEQERRAMYAALEVQVITRMTPALEAQRAALAKRLESQAHVTLDTPESVLLMAAHPAFYSPSVVRSEARSEERDEAPATVNAFAYASRMRQGDRPRGGMVKNASSRR